MSTPIAKKDDVSIFSSLSISQQQNISPTPENMIIHNDTTNNVIKISNRVFEATTSIGYKTLLHSLIYYNSLILCNFQYHYYYYY